MKVLASRVEDRKKFIKLALNNPCEAAKILKQKAKALEKSKRIADITKAVTETIFVTERTLYNDLKK